MSKKNVVEISSCKPVEMCAHPSCATNTPAACLKVLARTVETPVVKAVGSIIKHVVNHIRKSPDTTGSNEHDQNHSRSTLPSCGGCGNSEVEPRDHNLPEQCIDLVVKEVIYFDTTFLKSLNEELFNAMDIFWIYSIIQKHLPITLTGIRLTHMSKIKNHTLDQINNIYKATSMESFDIESFFSHTDITKHKWRNKDDIRNGKLFPTVLFSYSSIVKKYNIYGPGDSNYITQ